VKKLFNPLKDEDLWDPYAELAAAVQHTQQIEHPVVVALLPRRDRRVPRSVHEIARTRLCRGQRRHGRSADGPQRAPSS
jgi:hypothetical protein